MAEEYNTYSDGLGLYEITLDNIADIEKVAENFKTLNDRIGSIQSIELDGLGEDVSFKSVENFIKFMWQKVGNIELTDLKVKVTTDSNKTLDVVLNELKAKDTEIIKETQEKGAEILKIVIQIKQALDEYVELFGTKNSIHEAAVKELYKFLGGYAVEE